jgi:hypothetical protein
MDDLDRKIEEALNAEDRELLAQLGEQGVFAQWFGVYKGPFGWAAAYATVLTFTLVIAAIFCGWRLFDSADLIEAVRWSTAVIVLMVMVGFLKIWFWLRMESNRVLREIKRVELRIALAKGR